MKRRSNFALAATPGTVVLQRKLARRLATTIGNSLRFAKTGNRFPYDLVMNCSQMMPSCKSPNRCTVYRVHYITEIINSL